QMFADVDFFPAQVGRIQDDAPTHVHGTGTADADARQIVSSPSGVLEGLSDGVTDAFQAGVRPLVSLRLLASASQDGVVAVIHFGEHLGPAQVESDPAACRVFTHTVSFPS